MTSLLDTAALDRPPRRSFHLRDVEWRESGNGKDYTLTGLAAVFNSWSELLYTPRGAFRERFLPGCFDAVLATEPDVRLLKNHDKNFVLGRTKSGTLKLAEIEEGLDVWARVARTSYATDLKIAMERGDVDQMSLMFELDYDRGADDNWYEADGEVRHDVIAVSDLFDVSVVTFPAYLSTAAAFRELETAIARGRFEPSNYDGVLVGPSRQSPNDIRAAEGLPEATSRRRYERCRQVVAETAWAILPARLDMILSILSERIAGNKPSDEQIQERIGAQRDNAPQAVGGTAVVPLVGPVLSRAGAMSRVSAAKSLDTFRAEFRQALADPAIDSIVLDIDSPGGTADMVPEMAEEIFAARGRKPIVAVANAMAASAAYWLASAADELVVTPSGEVGSVGVYAAHTDLSRRMEQEGITTTFVKAGKYKAEGNPFEPLTDEAKAAIQADVDGIYDDFVAAVAKHRGVSTEQVLDEETGFGQGRTVRAQDALERGMVDGVETIDDVLRRLNGGALERARPYEPVEAGPIARDLGDNSFETREALRADLGLVVTPDDPAGTQHVTPDDPAGGSSDTPDDPAVEADPLTALKRASAEAKQAAREDGIRLVKESVKK